MPDTESYGNMERPMGHQISLRANADETPAVRVLKEYVNAQQIADPYKDSYGVGNSSWNNLQQPPYSFYALMKMPQDNSILSQCIDAMVTNVDGHGYRLEYIGPDDGGPQNQDVGSSSKAPIGTTPGKKKLTVGGENSPAALAEKAVFEDLLNFPNDDYTLQELRDRVRRDFETIGNAYIEIGRDQKGRIVMLSHIPAHTIRLTSKDADPAIVEVRLPRDGGKDVIRKVSKRFRRFVQMVGTQKVYFKEFGDPRTIDPADGQVKNIGAKGSKVSPATGKPIQGGPVLTIENSATEIIHLRIYNPASPYGMPRWFNQITTVLGTRQAEMVNLDFFRDNAIPAMVLMVSGGAVTQGSLDQIGDHFNSIRGRAAMNRVLVIEATGDKTAADAEGKIPPPKMEIKTLQGERQTDATWQEYDKNGMDKIRSAFRLPPLFVGRSEDQNYATARVSYDVAEGQVFAPERQRFDDMINLKILSGYEPKYWSFRSNPARLADKSDLVDAIVALDTVGALTPNSSIGIANELFDLEMKPVDGDWGNFPFPMVQAMIAAGKLKIEGLQNVEDAPLPVPGAPGGGGAGGTSAAAPKVTPGKPLAAPTLPKNPGVPSQSPAQGNTQTETPKQKISRVTTRAMLDLSEQLRTIREDKD